jgi:hypothetical protein
MPLILDFITAWDPYTHDNINKLEMVQIRAARYVQNNYHNTSSVTSMIDTLGWPTLAERRLKTRLIMLYKITHAFHLRFDCSVTPRFDAFNFRLYNCNK